MPSLNDLGLSEYEAKVYKALLRSGTATAKDMSRGAEVPMGRVYDVLGSLEKHSLIRSQTASRPKKYVAVEPETAIEKLVEDKQRKIEKEKTRYEEIADDLEDQLDANKSIEERFWTAAVGPEESIELLVERLDSAQDTIEMVTGSLSPQFDPDRVGDLVLGKIVDAVESGVDVKLIVDTELLWRFGADVRERYEDVLSENQNFEIRMDEGILGTFNLIDNLEICIEVTNPLDPNQVLAMIDLKDPEFSEAVSQEFDGRWEAADRLSF
ncbi:MAG: TrmB family transcriptional regulator [Halobacteria archaeon]